MLQKDIEDCSGRMTLRKRGQRGQNKAANKHDGDAVWSFKQKHRQGVCDSTGQNQSSHLIYWMTMTAIPWQVTRHDSTSSIFEARFILIQQNETEESMRKTSTNQLTIESTCKCQQANSSESKRVDLLPKLICHSHGPLHFPSLRNCYHTILAISRKNHSITRLLTISHRPPW